MKTNAKYKFFKMAGFEDIKNNIEHAKQQFSKARSHHYLITLPSSDI